MVKESKPITIYIPAVLFRPTHILYSLMIKCPRTCQQWSVTRRYSQFAQLRMNMLSTLNAAVLQNRSCPGCCSWVDDLQKQLFPGKKLFHSTSIIRKRVHKLNAFMSNLVQRIFDGTPKCYNCETKILELLRPFLLRGATPLNNSTLELLPASLNILPARIDMANEFKSRAKKAWSYASSTTDITPNASDSEYTTTTQQSLMMFQHVSQIPVTERKRWKNIEKNSPVTIQTA